MEGPLTASSSSPITPTRYSVVGARNPTHASPVGAEGTKPAALSPHSPPRMQVGRPSAHTLLPEGSTPTHRSHTSKLRK